MYTLAMLHGRDFHEKVALGGKILRVFVCLFSIATGNRRAITRTDCVFRTRPTEL